MVPVERIDLKTDRAALKDAQGNAETTEQGMISR